MIKINKIYDLKKKMHNKNKIMKLIKILINLMIY